MKKTITAFLLLLSVGGAYGQTLPLFKAEGTKLNGITAERKAKMEKALAVFERVMNDTLFQKELLALTFIYDVPNDPNRDLTTYQAVQKLYDAQEFYTPSPNNTANVYWTIKKKKRPILKRYPALGYGYPTDTTVYTYTWFFDDEDRFDEVVGHIAHEWSHKVGFQHRFKPHDDRDNTLPYAFGNLVKRHAARLIKPER